MRLDKAKPYSIYKDADKADAERRAKRKSLGEACMFFLGIGLAFWFLKSPDTFKASLTYLIGLFK